IQASPLSLPQTPAQADATADAVVAVTIALLVEAVGAGMLGTVAITLGETAGLTAAVGTLFAGGALGIGLGLATIGVIAFGMVVSVVAAGYVVSTLLPQVAQTAQRSHPQAVSGAGQTGEQTDDMHNANAAAANPMGIFNVTVSIDPMGNLEYNIPGRGWVDVDLNAPGVDTGDTSAPGLALGLSLSQTTPPSTVASDLVDVPGTMPDPGQINSDPGFCCDAAPDGSVSDGGMGLMMVFNPTGRVGLDGPAVPGIPTWLMTLLGVGLGGWALRRRWA